MKVEGSVFGTEIISYQVSRASAIYSMASVTSTYKILPRRIIITLGYYFSPPKLCYYTRMLTYKTNCTSIISPCCSHHLHIFGIVMVNTT